MRKKAQAAMEFLMTYGWAILVVLIAIGALMYFIKPADMMGEKCTLPTGSGLFCEKWGASEGSIDLKIKNVLDEAITIVAASSSINDTGGSCVPAGDVPIAANGVATVTFDTGGTCAALTVSGAKLQSAITITFTDPDAFSKTTAGSLIVRVP